MFGYRSNYTSQNASKIDDASRDISSRIECSRDTPNAYSARKPSAEVDCEERKIRVQINSNVNRSRKNFSETSQTPMALLRQRKAPRPLITPKGSQPSTELTLSVAVEGEEGPPNYAITSSTPVSEFPSANYLSLGQLGAPNGSSHSSLSRKNIESFTSGPSKGLIPPGTKTVSVYLQGLKKKYLQKGSEDSKQYTSIERSNQLKSTKSPLRSAIAQKNRETQEKATVEGQIKQIAKKVKVKTLKTGREPEVKVKEVEVKKNLLGQTLIGEEEKETTVLKKARLEEKAVPL